MINGAFNINKPAGMTSNDVVCILRKKLNMKKIGHGGTLDPEATGVLPVFTGTATRLLNFAVHGQKEYVAEYELGKRTDTGDISGKIIEEQLVPKLDITEVNNVLKKFCGLQKQVPPMYSAIKINGIKLYQLARQGKEVERKSREIMITKLKLVEWHPPFFRIKVECSKGTYIRVLGEDIARALGTVAVMTKLVRTRVGNFNLEDAHTIEEVGNNPEQYAKNIVDIIDLPKMTLSPKQAYRLTSGVPTTIKGTADGEYILLSPEGELLAVGRAEQEIIRVNKVLAKYEDPDIFQST